MIKLAKKVAENDLIIESREKNNSWFKKQAKLADIEIDTNFCKGTNTFDNEELKKLKNQNQNLKKELNLAINSLNF